MATKVYRDYGALNNMSAPNNKFDIKRYTQVYQATHQGEERLPFMNRSFISFSYGEKDVIVDYEENGVTKQKLEKRPVYIEDFNLIATISGDRWEREAYSSFEDLTSTYDTIPGQFYWGTYFHSTTLDFTLSTDGMTQRELDDFKFWFRAGQIKELILSEHPNRAAYARVAAPPQLKLLPFEAPVTLALGYGGATTSNAEGEVESVSAREYKTSTTLYKGEIELQLVLDEPFWYAKHNVLGEQNTLNGYYSNRWSNANATMVNVEDSTDALKIVYEDRIPLGSTTAVSVFLGGDTYASVVYDNCSLIANKEYGGSTIDATIYEAHVNSEANWYNNGTDIWNGTSWISSEPEEEIPQSGEGSSTEITEQPAQGGSTVTEEVGGNETPTESVSGDETEAPAQSGDDGNGEVVEEVISGSENITIYRFDSDTKYFYGAIIASVTNENTENEHIIFGGTIGGTMFKATDGQAPGIDLKNKDADSNNLANLYYAGTAPSPVTLSFKLSPTFSGNCILTSPKNTYTGEEITENTITLVATREHKFSFTIPTLYASYNQVLQIFDNTDIMYFGQAWLTVRETIRETIRHPLIRAWANKMIDRYDNENGNGTIHALTAASDGATIDTISGIQNDLKQGMQCLFRTFDDTSYGQNPQYGYYDASFSFDGKTGEAKGEFTTWDPNTLVMDKRNQTSSDTLENYIHSKVTDKSLEIREWAENVGDMVKSSYLILDERNTLDDNLQVQSWQELHPDYAYKIYHDVEDRLKELHFKFKNMYL